MFAMSALGGTALLPALPGGSVALFFSDIEGSTGLLQALGATYESLLDDHDAIIRSAFERHGGVEVKNEGDAFFAAFADHGAAVSAAVEMQRDLDAHPWPGGCVVKVRMGLHAGQPLLRGRDYWGVDVHYAARLAGAAHGGQVLISDLMRRTVPRSEAVSLGQHGLKDFPAPRELFQLVVDDRGPHDFPPPRTLSAYRNNLPTTYAPLFGRAPVIDEMVRRLAGQDKVVSLVGPGGMGKTRVAVAAAEELAPDFPDGLVFVPLAAVAEDDRVPAAIADAVGTARGADAEAALVQRLAASRMLVVVDNAEHLPGVAAVITRLVDAAPGCRFLVTTQAPLAVRAERVVALEPLDDPAAIAMFRDRAGSLDAADDEVLALCRNLDRVPLALEIAAARVALTGVAGLRSALERDPDHALGSGPHDLPERQRGLRAALAWTTDLLTPSERTVFAGLGAFAEAWTIEQAEALFAAEAEVDTWAALERLLSLSLLVRRGDGRLSMPERTRRHARAVLADAGEVDRCRRGHAGVVLEALRPRLIEYLLDHRRGLANVADELGEIVHAFDWARVHDLALAARLCAGSSHMAGALGARASVGGRGAFLDSAEEPVTRALLLAGLAVGTAYGEEIDRSFEQARTAVGLAADDPVMRLFILNLVAHPWGDRGRSDEALAALDEAAEIAARLPDHRWREYVESSRLITLVHLGRYEEAWPGLLAVAADEGRTDFNSQWANSYLGDCALGFGDYATALRYFHVQLGLLDERALGSRFAQLQGVAAAQAGLGQDEQAVELTSAIRHHSRLIAGPGDDVVVPMYAMIVAEAAARLGPRAAACEAAGARWSLDDLLRIGGGLAG